MNTTNTPQRAAPQRQLNLFDSTNIIVGIIVGAGIYESSPLIAANVSSPLGLLGVWLLGGLLSLLGGLCYAELANAFPREGGDYVYLTRAFGRGCGFLFAWAQLWVVRPGSIGAMAFVFAKYAHQLWPLNDDPHLSLVWYAVGSVLLLSVVNVLGVPPGKWTQNILTSAKVLGLLAVVAVGLLVWAPRPAPVEPSSSSGSNFWLAMIFIFYAYGGWNEMAYVGAEVRNPERNILRALVLGTLAVTGIYVLVNLAFLHALGFEGMRNASAIAAQVLSLATGDWGARFISVLICISALGAINGMTFTGARIYYAMGQDHRLFAWLGRWSPTLGTPVWSLVIQGAITLALIVVFGSGFESMVIFTTPVFWIFLLLVGLSLFVLRWREPQAPRPFRVPLYPIVPLVFCLSSGFMVYNSLDYAIAKQSNEALWSILLLGLGLVVMFALLLFSRTADRQQS